MARFTYDPGLTLLERGYAVRQLQRTHHLSFGQKSWLGGDHPADEDDCGRAGCPLKKPAARLLRELIGQLEASGTVDLPVSFTEFDHVQLSDVLRQAAAQRALDPGMEELPGKLHALHRAWDKRFRVPDDEMYRTQILSYPGRVAEGELAKREAERARRWVELQERQPRPVRRVLVDGDDEPEPVRVRLGRAG